MESLGSVFSQPFAAPSGSRAFGTNASPLYQSSHGKNLKSAEQTWANVSDHLEDRVSNNKDYFRKENGQYSVKLTALLDENKTNDIDCNRKDLEAYQNKYSLDGDDIFIPIDARGYRANVEIDVDKNEIFTKFLSNQNKDNNDTRYAFKKLQSKSSTQGSSIKEDHELYKVYNSSENIKIFIPLDLKRSVLEQTETKQMTLDVNKAVNEKKTDSIEGKLKSTAGAIPGVKLEYDMKTNQLTIKHDNLNLYMVNVPEDNLGTEDFNKRITDLIFLQENLQIDSSLLAQNELSYNCETKKINGYIDSDKTSKITEQIQKYSGAINKQKGEKFIYNNDKDTLVIRYETFKFDNSFSDEKKVKEDLILDQYGTINDFNPKTKINSDRHGYFEIPHNISKGSNKLEGDDLSNFFKSLTSNKNNLKLEGNTLSYVLMVGNNILKEYEIGKLEDNKLVINENWDDQSYEKVNNLQNSITTLNVTKNNLKLEGNTLSYVLDVNSKKHNFEIGTINDNQLEKNEGWDSVKFNNLQNAANTMHNENVLPHKISYSEEQDSLTYEDDYTKFTLVNDEIKNASELTKNIFGERKPGVDEFRRTSKRQLMPKTFGAKGNLRRKLIETLNNKANITNEDGNKILTLDGQIDLDTGTAFTIKLNSGDTHIDITFNIRTDENIKNSEKKLEKLNEFISNLKPEKTLTVTDDHISFKNKRDIFSTYFNTTGLGIKDNNPANTAKEVKSSPKRNLFRKPKVSPEEGPSSPNITSEASTKENSVEQEEKAKTNQSQAQGTSNTNTTPQESKKVSSNQTSSTIQTQAQDPSSTKTPEALDEDSVINPDYRKDSITSSSENEGENFEAIEKHNKGVKDISKMDYTENDGELKILVKNEKGEEKKLNVPTEKIDGIDSSDETLSFSLEGLNSENEAAALDPKGRAMATRWELIDLWKKGSIQINDDNFQNILRSSTIDVKKGDKKYHFNFDVDQNNYKTIRSSHQKTLGELNKSINSTPPQTTTASENINTAKPNQYEVKMTVTPGVNSKTPDKGDLDKIITQNSTFKRSDSTMFKSLTSGVKDFTIFDKKGISGINNPETLQGKYESLDTKSKMIILMACVEAKQNDLSTADIKALQDLKILINNSTIGDAIETDDLKGSEGAAKGKVFESFIDHALVFAQKTNSVNYVEASKVSDFSFDDIVIDCMFIVDGSVSVIQDPNDTLNAPGENNNVVEERIEAKRDKEGIKNVQDLSEKLKRIEEDDKKGTPEIIANRTKEEQNYNKKPPPPTEGKNSGRIKPPPPPR